jgi:ubiquitin carboxyl-terminal hydrolase L5
MAPKRNGITCSRRDAKLVTVPAKNTVKKSPTGPRSSSKPVLNSLVKIAEDLKSETVAPQVNGVSVPKTPPHNFKHDIDSSPLPSSLAPSVLSEVRKELDLLEPEFEEYGSPLPTRAASTPRRTEQPTTDQENYSAQPDALKTPLPPPSSPPRDFAAVSTKDKEDGGADALPQVSRAGSSSPLGKRKREDMSKTGENGPVEPIEAHIDDTVSTNTEKPDDTTRAKRARKDIACTAYKTKSADDFQPPYAVATAEEKRAWKGWVEIESNPSIFNVMLREFGIAGVKVQEIYSLDEDILATLPLPIYGVIFLFQYQATDEGTQNAPCPSNIWFANQLKGTNACGTIALLNIVNNVADVDLGVELRHFKQETTLLTPKQRGERIDGYTHVKVIHNSFARKLDILQMDLGLYQDRENVKKRAAKAAKAAASARNATPAKGKGKGKGKAASQAGTPSKSTPSKKVQAYDNESAFHYVAYMPIDGVIWKLDGLDKEPQNLGECDHDTWLNVIAPLLQERMAEFSSSGVNFNMMALVKDPLIEQRHDLSANIKLIQAIEQRLNSLKPEWRSFDDADVENAITSPDSTYGITGHTLDSTPVLPSAAAKVELDTSPTTLLEFRKRTLGQQTSLRAAIRAEMEGNAVDEKKAEDERKDYGPFVQAWLKELADCGELREIAEKVKAEAEEKKAKVRKKARR